MQGSADCASTNGSNGCCTSSSAQAAPNTACRSGYEDLLRQTGGERSTSPFTSGFSHPEPNATLGDTPEHHAQQSRAHSSSDGEAHQACAASNVTSTGLLQTRTQLDLQNGTIDSLQPAHCRPGDEPKEWDDDLKKLAEQVQQRHAERAEISGSLMQLQDQAAVLLSQQRDMLGRLQKLETATACGASSLWGTSSSKQSHPAVRQ